MAQQLPFQPSSIMGNVPEKDLPSNNARVILEQSKKLFQKKGYSGTSVNDIALASGVTKPTIYHYYGDKENLYAEVMIDMLRRGYQHLQVGIKPHQGIRHHLLKLTEGFMKNRPMSLASMMQEAQEKLSPLAQKKINEAYRYYLVSTFDVLFSQGVDSGEIKPLCTTDMALLYMSIIDGYTSNRTVYSGRDFDCKALSEFVVTALLDGLAARLPDAGVADDE